MFDHTNPAASLLAVLVVTYLVHSTIFLGSAWLVATLARLRSHALSERLWKSAAILGLVTAPAQLLLGSMAFGVEIPLFTSPETGSTAVEASSTNHQARFDISEKHTVMVRPRQSEANASLDVSESIETEDSTAKTPVDHVVIATPQLEVQPRDLTAYFPSEEPQLNESSVVTSDSLRSGLRSEEQRETDEIHSDSERLVTAGSPLQTTSSNAQSTVGVTSIALIIIFLGALTMGLETFALRRRFAAADSVDDGAARDVLDRLLIRYRVRRRVRLLSSNRCSEPIAFGLFRWTVVIPDRIETQLPRDELRALFAHELAHLCRGDVRWLWIGRILCRCLAFQPLNLLARRRWQREAEFLCDDWAVERGQSPMMLARCLARVAEWRLGETGINNALAAGGTSSTIVLRVERLVAESHSPDLWKRPWRTRILTASCVMAAVAVVSIGPRAAFSINVRPSLSNDTAVQTTGAFVATDKDTLPEWHLLEEELLQLENELTQVNKLLRQTPNDREMHATQSAISKRVDQLRQRWEILAELINNQTATQSDGS